MTHSPIVQGLGLWLRIFSLAELFGSLLNPDGIQDMIRFSFGGFSRSRRGKYI